MAEMENENKILDFDTIQEKRTDELMELLDRRDMKQLQRRMEEMNEFDVAEFLSELDSSRQNYLLNNISDTQTIITCTGLDEFVRNRFTVNRVFEVIAGHVYERSI